MAKLTDKFFNRVIEGDLELSSGDKSKNGITKVVANPTLAGTEAGLEGLEVSGTKYSVKKGAVAGVEGAPSGTLDTVLGLDSNGKLAKGSVSGGTQLYLHDIKSEQGDYHIIAISKSNTQLSMSDLFSSSDVIDFYFKDGNYHAQILQYLGGGIIYLTYQNTQAVASSAVPFMSVTDTVTPL